MPNLNRCEIIGHLGRDPEVKYTPSGMAICEFSVAVSEKRKDKETTEWFNVVFFNKAAETIGKYVKKGNAIYVDGRIQTQTWEDNNGNKHYKTQLIGNNFQFLTSKNKGTSAPDNTDNDIPF